MNNENRSSNLEGPTVRITRARAKALGSSSGLPPLHPSAKENGKQVLRGNLKRAASDNSNLAENPAACPQPKRRAVLKDVTNIKCDNLYINCINAARGQPSRQDKKGSLQKKEKVAPARFAQNSNVPEDRRSILTGETIKVEVEETQEVSPEANLTIEPTKINARCPEVNLTIEPTKINARCPEVNLTIEPTKINARYLGTAARSPMKTESSKVPMISPSDREDGMLGVQQENLEDRGITDIDSKHKDPLMCSLYAEDIYSHLYARQVDRRPLTDYMEKLQRDITHGMRGILIDWLVEVSEEYRLVPDTLYLTVNLIDRFLSENFIEKKKLQLLGVTSMLIASKYEEICAPRVEEFCFITDNTYTKEEVVQMESRILNFIGFQVSVPTTKKFLRRFIQAAQVSYKVPSVELEFLANYLAELTLIDYSFLKFLPSIIAASAVFLARWTLDQSDHPWNPTLEHYTRHKIPELKTAVLELHELQNATKCMLNVIRDKYKQSKFKCVSDLRSPSVESLF